MLGNDCLASAYHLSSDTYLASPAPHSILHDPLRASASPRPSITLSLFLSFPSLLSFSLFLFHFFLPLFLSYSVSSFISFSYLHLPSSFLTSSSFTLNLTTLTVQVSAFLILSLILPHPFPHALTSSSFIIFLFFILSSPAYSFILLHSFVFSRSFLFTILYSFLVLIHSFFLMHPSSYSPLFFSLSYSPSPYRSLSHLLIPFCHSYSSPLYSSTFPRYPFSPFLTRLLPSFTHTPLLVVVFLIPPYLLYPILPLTLTPFPFFFTPTIPASIS